VLPALLGVSIGRNPTGAVERILTDLGPLKRARPAVVGAIAVVAVSYLLARNETISNWWLIVITIVVLAALNLVTRRVTATDRRAEAAAALPGEASADLPLELVGVARPFTVADREMLDAALGVPAEKG
jgi:branched-chain amino acid transport system permease protein